MRPKLRALIVVVLVGLCASQQAAAEPGSRWWPFGHSEDEDSLATDAPEVNESGFEEQPSAGTQDFADEEAEPGWMIESPLAKVSWPRFHMPDVPKPSLPRPGMWSDEPEVEGERNTWVDEEPVAESSPWQAMKGGAQRMGSRTRAAWDKTVDTLTPGEQPRSSSSRVARRSDRLPWWKRLFSAEGGEPEGPQTIPQWMAQERLDP